MDAQHRYGQLCDVFSTVTTKWFRAPVTHEGLTEEAFMSRSAYLPHLDGLRAVALFFVLLYHFELGPSKGGFVGVDIFFVLSGYLVTRNILGQLEAGHFSLNSFYRRRFWRLAPCSVWVVGASLVAAHHYFPSSLALAAAKSGVAATFAVSNILFSSQAGYADESKIFKPLLHMWSLSVEEQFYLLWPATVVVLWHRKMRQYLPAATAALLGASLLLSAGLPVTYAIQNWYWLPFRAFEFAAGALVLWAPPPQGAPLTNAISLFGLALVLGTLVSMNDNVVFPGLYGLPPVIGAVALIGTPGSVFSRWVLEHPLMRWIGKVSYSAYLIHWPLWVFVRFLPVDGVMPTVPVRTALLVFSVVFGGVQYYAIENPMRTSPRMNVKRAVMAALVGLVAAATYLIYRTSLKPSFPLPPDMKNLDSRATRCLQRHKEVVGAYSTCHEEWPDEKHPSPPPPAIEGEIKAVLIGDSYAGQLTTPSCLAGEASGGVVLRLPVSGCAPYFATPMSRLEETLYKHTRRGAMYIQHCNKCHEAWPRQLARVPPTTIILAAAWQYQFSFGIPDEVPLGFLSDTIDAIHSMNHSAVVIGLAPHAGTVGSYDVEFCMGRPDNRRCIREAPPLPIVLEKTKIIRDRALSKGAQYVDLFPTFCNANATSCFLVQNELPLYHGSHFTRAGVLKVVPVMEELLRNISSERQRGGLDARVA